MSWGVGDVAGMVNDVVFYALAVAMVDYGGVDQCRKEGEAKEKD